MINNNYECSPAYKSQGNVMEMVLYSRSYAEDVTSVTSGASQGPHSFKLGFVCLFVSRLALFRICPVPYRTIKHSWPHTAGRNIQIRE